MYEKEDVTGDNAIDIFDIQAVIDAFGTNDTNADIDGNGVVDIFDLQRVIDAME